MRHYFYLLLAVLLLSSCQPEEATPIVKTSPDGKNKIIVTAEKESLAGDWTVKLAFKPANLDEQFVKFELSAADITEDNVHFEWKDDNNGIVTFEHSDGEKRAFQFFISENRAQLIPIGQ